MILSTMIISYLLLIIFPHFFICAKPDPSRQANLISISSFPGLEEYYLLLRQQRLEERLDPISRSVESTSSSRQLQNPLLEEPRSSESTLSSRRLRTPLLEEPRSSESTLSSRRLRTPLLEESRSSASTLSPRQRRNPLLDEPRSSNSTLSSRQLQNPLLEEPRSSESTLSPRQLRNPLLDEPRSSNSTLSSRQLPNPLLEEPRSSNFTLGSTQPRTPFLEELRPSASTFSSRQLRNPWLEEPGSASSTSSSMQHREEDENEEIPLTDEEAADIKKKLCKKIFHSNFFDARGEEWIDLDQAESYKYLKSKERELFNKIFSKKVTRRKMKLLICGSSRYEHEVDANPRSRRHQLLDRTYVNRIQKLPVSFRIGRNQEEENVFICPVRKRSSRREIKGYYVSEVYNVNVAYRNPEAPYIAGRFIFEYSGGKLLVTAFAEEPAKGVLIGSDAEMKYAKMKRENSQSSLDDERKHDPIYRLTVDQRIRLCASIFSSEIFEKEVKYLPISYYGCNKECEKNTISFTDADARESSPHNSYPEWTVVCTPSERNNELIPRPTTFYISGADRFNRIFLHAVSSGRHKFLYPLYYFTHVSVIARGVLRNKAAGWAI